MSGKAGQSPTEAAKRRRTAGWSRTAKCSAYGLQGAPQDLAIGSCRADTLLFALGLGEAPQQLVVAGHQPRAIGPWPHDPQATGLPIDQGAVTIESDGIVIAAAQGRLDHRRSSMASALVAPN